MPMGWRKPVSLAALGVSVASAPSAASAQALEKGRLLTERLFRGAAAELLPNLSPKFVQAVGGAPGLTAMAARLKDQAGAETRVVSEHAFREGGFTSYYRVSEFEKGPSLTTRWAWSEDGAVIVGNVKATPTPAATPHRQDASATVLELPLGRPTAGRWYVAWGGPDAVHNYHVSVPNQRFAYDFVVMRDGGFRQGEGLRNEDHFCFGAPVAAPGNGRVVVAADGAPDNSRPGVKDGPGGPGNHVVIDHGNQKYSLVAHLRLNSVAVRAGQTVQAGDHLGVCGNSGASDLPHVHYHLQTGAAYLQGVGLPVRFKNYFLGGRLIAAGEPLRGDLLEPAAGGSAP